MVPMAKSSIFIMKMILAVYGTLKYPLGGILPNIKRRYHETNSDFTREQMRLYMTELTCKTCHGYRLNPQSIIRQSEWQSILVNLVRMAINNALSFVEKLTLSEQEKMIAKPIVKKWMTG